jgi:hypothetical protein
VVVVVAHPESHAVDITNDLALNKLAVIAAEAHRDMDPSRHRNRHLPHTEKF